MLLTKYPATAHMQHVVPGRGPIVFTVASLPQVLRVVYFNETLSEKRFISSKILAIH